MNHPDSSSQPASSTASAASRSSAAPTAPAGSVSGGSTPDGPASGGPRRPKRPRTDSRTRIPWHRWRPKLLECLAGYGRQQATADVVAGITVGLVALPLAMAFGIASGVTPQAGIYTAIVGGFIVSALGGSRIQIGGPTGAFVVIVAGIIAQHGLSGLLMAREFQA